MEGPSISFSPSCLTKPKQCLLQIITIFIRNLTFLLSHLVLREDTSRSATVMGIAIGLDTKPFVNSLRATGYSGHIILGVRHDIDNTTLQYFEKNCVTPKLLEFSHCTFEPFYTNETIKNEGDPHNIAGLTGLTICIKSYPDIKER